MKQRLEVEVPDAYLRDLNITRGWGGTFPLHELPDHLLQILNQEFEAIRIEAESRRIENNLSQR